MPPLLNKPRVQRHASLVEHQEIAPLFHRGLVLMILLLAVLGTTLVSGCAPEAYEDCIAKVAKDAKTEASVTLGTAACDMKFRKGRAKNLNSLVDGRCSYYWTGFEFSRGDQSGSDYLRVRLDHQDGFGLLLAFPRAMVSEEVRNQQDKLDAWVKGYLAREELYLKADCKEVLESSTAR